ncbi:LLM class flavin-dependent oxidoreductase [Halorarius litoreus]|uniref:LLM class flavin-dependent oxidoreductase n=1 Tax=Halorarius litoreus TaxID=2962676 RepID=UPI0020CC4C40|nr:LLM class flavin-dependent oxidoreductase [Halorarius litoreus]
MKFGAFLNQYYYPESGFGVEDIVAQAELMDELGFDSATLGERHVHEEGFVEPITGLAAIAARTDLDIGTAAMLPALYDPLHLAEQVAMLDQIASGNMHFGAVIGYRERELKAFGVEIDERVERFIEAMRILTQLWEDDSPVTHHGEYYDYEDVFISPQPDSEMPIWIGGHADIAIKRAAYRGDGWIASASSTPDDLREQITTYEAAIQEFNQRRADNDVILMRDCFIAESEEAAREAVEPYLLNLYEWYERWGQTYLAEHDVGVDWETLAEKFIIGTPETAAEAFEMYDEMGVDHMLLRWQFPGQPQDTTMECIERLGDVISEFQ